MSLLLCDKACLAWENVLAPYVAPQVQINISKKASDKVLPCLTISADGEGEEDPPRSGNFWIPVVIESRWKGVANEDGTGQQPDPFTVNQSALAVLDMGIFQDPQVLAAELSAATPNFTVLPMGILFDSPSTGKDENGIWIDSVRVRLYCCSSSLAP